MIDTDGTRTHSLCHSNSIKRENAGKQRLAIRPRYHRISELLIYGYIAHFLLQMEHNVGFAIVSVEKAIRGVVLRASRALNSKAI